jgi:hypothetical protein
MKFLKFLTYVGILFFFLTVLLVFNQYYHYRLSLFQKETVVPSSQKERITLNNYPVSLEELQIFIENLDQISKNSTFKSTICSFTANNSLLCFPLDQAIVFLNRGSFFGFLFDLNDILEKEKIVLNNQEAICLNYEPKDYLTSPLLEVAPENIIFAKNEESPLFCYQLNPQKRYKIYLFGFVPREDKKIKIGFYKLNQEEIDLLREKKAFDDYLIKNKQPFFERVSQ